MDKFQERKINDSYKLLNGKCLEKIHRLINNPLMQKKVPNMPFSNELNISRISLINKVIKWINITIETIEKAR